MGSGITTRFAVGGLAFCLFVGCVSKAKAQWPSSVVTPADVVAATFGPSVEGTGGEVVSGVARRGGGAKDGPLRLDVYQEERCERFQQDQVFSNFAQAFRSPENVKCLIIQNEDPEMKHLPSRLGDLVNLEVLEISCLEKLEDLPEEIGKLRRLEELIIDNGNGCQMNVSLPRSIGRLENLRVLRLYGALDARGIGPEQPARRPKSKSLPDTLADLRKLEELDLGRNGLRAVPPQIAPLRQLKKLGLDYNEIRELPPFVGNFARLEELSLRSNGGVKLPRTLAGVEGLRVFMGNNALTLVDQKSLGGRFPNIVFFFDNEFDDSAANEEPPKPKTRRGRRR